MGTGAITGYIDVAQIALYVFWVFFAGLIFYLRREDRREGYPLEADTTGELENPGTIWFPPAKTFRMAHGADVLAPNDIRDSSRELHARRTAPWPGAPIEPTGNPMLDGVGPGGYALRADHPDLDAHGKPKILPMRVATDFQIEPRDPDPRGMTVIAADKGRVGTVTDAWVDTSEHLIRYLEVELPGAETPRRVLLPINFAVLSGSKRTVYVHAILANQFGDVPTTKSADEITMLEEEKICAYYGAGQLYATPERAEPYI